jgi:hypothetical protein
MGKILVRKKKMRNANKSWSGNLKRSHLGDQDVNGKIILKWTL